MATIRIQKASRDTATTLWIIRCAVQPTHGFGYLPVMTYAPQPDLFWCSACGQQIKADEIYWTLPEVVK